MNVVFHADDFGLSHAVNAGILEAHRRGVLGSTSLILTADAADDALALARATPTLDVGLHLTLVEERPVLPPADVPTLVDGDRLLRSHGAVVARWLTGRWSVAEACRELDAQWARFDATGLPIAHCDGHQHLHLLPGVLAATVRAARRRSVRFVRGTLVDPGAPLDARRAVELGLDGVAALAWRGVPAGLRREVVRVPTLGFVGAGGGLTVDGVLATLDRLRRRVGDAGTVEVMLHPGHRDEETARRYAHWHYRWENDFELLCDPRLADGLARRGMVPTSFAALAARHGEAAEAAHG